MDRLLKIARDAEPGPGICFSGKPYGKSGLRRFLTDVLSLANASVSGKRYIVTGVEVDAAGRRRFTDAGRQDGGDAPPYASLVADFIEPPVTLRHERIALDERELDVFEIADCQDRPYMMRADFSERLRRGDAYVRVEEGSVKMGRRQLQDLFAGRFRDAVGADRIEIGFPGDILHKRLTVETVDLGRMPSAVESDKLRQLIDVKEQSTNSGATTTLARLTHARLFGSDSPFEDPTTTSLLREAENVRDKYEADDRWFLFGTHANALQVTLLNQGEEPLENASLTLLMPAHEAFLVATELPLPPGEEANPVRLGEYPPVSIRDGRIQVTTIAGDVPPDLPTEAFDIAPRYCVGAELAGRRLAIRYTLSAKNLRRPAQGKLYLSFRSPRAIAAA